MTKPIKKTPKLAKPSKAALSDTISGIAGIDFALGIVRELWLEAADDPKERTKYRVKIDKLLDQRITLMARRDGPKVI